MSFKGMKRGMNITCTRKIRFDGAHRIKGHESVCANLHGHGYEVEFTARNRAQNLDQLGRVIDFSVLKERLGDWILKNWDHTAILWEEDTEAVELARKLQVSKPVYVTPFNPTAENMARYLLEEICPMLLKDTQVEIVKVKVMETPNCFAEASL